MRYLDWIGKTIRFLAFTKRGHIGFFRWIPVWLRIRKQTRSSWRYGVCFVRSRSVFLMRTPDTVCCVMYWFAAASQPARFWSFWWQHPRYSRRRTISSRRFVKSIRRLQPLFRISMEETPVWYWGTKNMYCMEKDISKMNSADSGSVFRPVPSIRLTQFRLRSCTEKRWNWQDLQAKSVWSMHIAESERLDWSPATRQRKSSAWNWIRMLCGMQS